MERLRSRIPSVKFTTDIIAGFPGETEEEFAETLAFAKRAEFLHIHAFPYSKRAGTPAATMKDQVPEEVKRARVRALNAVSDETCCALLTKAMANHAPLSVLFETYQPKTGLYHGHTPDFMEVAVFSDRDLRGCEATVTPAELKNGFLLATL